ncbi:MAG: DedA family protein, partial [Epsilonproteobacteria bacterium]|nr:DedA family protein [Campylobacterota bacterium]
LFLYSFGGGMLALAIAGVFSSTGDLNIYYVISVAIVSNFIGDQFLFLIARNNKSYAKSMMSKLGRKIALTHIMMRKYGVWILFIKKYIYGIKTIVPLAMGLTKFDFKKFTIYNLLASIVWGVVVGMISYFLGQIFIDSLEEYKNLGIIALILLFVLIFQIFKRY